MNRLVAFFILCFAAIVWAGPAPFTVTDILNKDKAEENTYAINRNFEDLLTSKVAVSSNTPGLPYSISDISDPDQAEENAFALMENFRYCWDQLLEPTGSTGSVRMTITDLANPDLAEENEVAIQINFEDLYNAKQDL